MQDNRHSENHIKAKAEAECQRCASSGGVSLMQGNASSPEVRSNDSAMGLSCELFT